MNISRCINVCSTSPTVVSVATSIDAMCCENVKPQWKWLFMFKKYKKIMETDMQTYSFWEISPADFFHTEDSALEHICDT